MNLRKRLERLERQPAPNTGESIGAELRRLLDAIGPLPDSAELEHVARAADIAESAGDVQQVAELREEFHRRLKAVGIQLFQRGEITIVQRDDFYGNDAHRLPYESAGN